MLSFLGIRKRHSQVLHDDEKVELLRKCANQWAGIAVFAPEMLHDRLAAIEQNLDIQDFQRQTQHSLQAPGLLEKLLASLEETFSCLLVFRGDSAHQLTFGAIGEVMGVAGRGLAHDDAKLQALMASHHDPVAPLKRYAVRRPKPAEIARRAVAN
jgi:hypothetical protein